MFNFWSRNFHRFVPSQFQQAFKSAYHSLQVTIQTQRAQQDPTDPAAMHDLAMALVGKGEWQDAIAACERAIQQDPQCPWIYKTLAEAYMGQGLWDAAITASQQAIDRDCGISWLYHTLGKAYIGQENWTAAIAACQQAIERDPNVAWFYYHLGEAQVKGGDWSAAVPTLKRTIELEPDFAWSYYYLAEALLAQGETAAAIAIYQQVTQQHDIAYLRDCLHYAQHLQAQEQRIQQFCQQAQQRDQQGREGDRLRILMLTPYPTYPPKQGAIARMYYEMRGLAAHHELVLMSFIFTKGDYKLEAPLEQDCDLAITVMIGDALPRTADQPALIHRYSSERLRHLLRLIQPAQFDIVLCDFIYMAQYIDLFPEAFHVLGEHNIESRLLQRCAAVQQDQTQQSQTQQNQTQQNQAQQNQTQQNQTRLQQIAQQSTAVRAFVESDRESALLAAYEDRYWPKFPLRMVVSEQDRLEMAARCAQGKTIVVNNGIDTQQVQLLPPTRRRQILFIGTMSYYPNIDGVTYFVEEILPIVWRQDRSVRFWIAGAEPPQVVLDLAQDRRIQVIANPEDMREVAKQAAITVVPLRIGSGTRIKILHSMAMGLPVISTTLGCEGLQVTDGIHLLIRDQPEAFAAGILQLLKTPTLRQTLRQQGRNLVETHYDWQQGFAAAERQILAEFQQWQRQQSPSQLSS